MDICNIINSKVENSPKFSKNSISIALFFDCNREKYEHTSLINLYSFPIFQFKVTATKSTIFCQFFPINCPPFEPFFPFESLFLLLFTPVYCRGNPAVKEDVKRIKTRREDYPRFSSQNTTREGLHHCHQEGCFWRSENPFAPTLENREFTWTTTFRIINFYCVFWSVRFFLYGRMVKGLSFSKSLH